MKNKTKRKTKQKVRNKEMTELKFPGLKKNLVCK